MFHAKWQRAFHILLRFSFIVFLAGAAKTIKDTEDFNPATVRKGSAFCWHSQLAELEWWHFHYPLPSWRIPALVGQALNCFTLLLHVFSLFPLTPSLNAVKQSLSSDSTYKRALLCLVSSGWESPQKPDVTSPGPETVSYWHEHRGLHWLYHRRLNWKRCVIRLIANISHLILRFKFKPFLLKKYRKCKYKQKKSNYDERHLGIIIVLYFQVPSGA